jgi:hypothetical protein
LFRLRAATHARPAKSATLAGASHARRSYGRMAAMYTAADLTLAQQHVDDGVRLVTEQRQRIAN